MELAYTQTNWFTFSVILQSALCATFRYRKHVRFISFSEVKYIKLSFVYFQVSKLAFFFFFHSFVVASQPIQYLVVLLALVFQGTGEKPFRGLFA